MTRQTIGAFLLVLAAVAAPAAAAQKVAVGIAPVYDASAAVFGPVLAQHLTLFAYQDMLKESAAAYPYLLSPGGVYSPLDTSWLVDYVQDRTDLDVLLVSTLKQVTNPDKRKWNIPVDLQLLDAHSGNSLAEWTVYFEVSSWKTLTDYGTPIEGQRTGFGGTLFVGVPSRNFEKQPLGKATAQLARSIRESLDAKLASLPSTKGTAKAVAAGSLVLCPVNAKITYGYKHSASQSYMLMVNGMDQSTTIKDGVSTFNAPEGEVLLQFSVKDAPYKLMKEELYQLSLQHSCKYTTLIVDLAKGGDAHPRWE